MEVHDLVNMSLLDISIDDVFDYNTDEPLWDKLIQQIIDGNVIPVIGADLLMDGSMNLHRLIVDAFAKKFGITSTPQTFSELVYSPEYKSRYRLDDIYYLVFVFEFYSHIKYLHEHKYFYN